MPMITVQPIGPEEIDYFIAAGKSSGFAAEVKKYLEHMIELGSVRIDWCFVVKEGNDLSGRIAYWTLPKDGTPLAMILLELPWERSNYLSIGELLLKQTLPHMRALGAKTIEYVLDVPIVAPQWQRYPEERVKLLEQAGFQLSRETFRFQWEFQDTKLVNHEGLLFKTLTETGEATFIDAIERVNHSMLDRRQQFERDQNGANVYAAHLLRELQQMEYEPSWWQLAYTLDGELVGLVMPAKSPTFATIGYIGIVPEQRGRGYIDLLLGRGTAILNKAGAEVIRADTDVNNIPMANAFKRMGYVQFARRREYSIKLAE